jgi:hypothetical protein
VFHYREDHIRLCWLALLLIRVIETGGGGGTWRSTITSR